MPRSAPTGIASITTTAPGPSRLGQSEIFPETNYYFGADTFQNDLEYMDMLEQLRDAAEGIGSSIQADTRADLADLAMTPVEKQRAAAQKYAELVGLFPTKAEDIAAVQDAKDELVALGVTREQLEKAGIDTSRGISGVMGPTIEGALSQGIEKGSELFGLGAEGLASLVGADKALSSALLNLPKPGVTFVFDESGKKRPLITGQTSGGTQVGITDPYGIADILAGLEEGSLRLEDVIGAGAGAVKAATAYTGDDDPNKKTGVDTGVAITPEGPTPDKPKIPAGDAGLPKDKGAGVGGVSPRIVGPGLDAGPGPGPSDKIPTLKLPEFPTNKVPALTLPDFPTLSLPEDRPLTLPDFDPTKTERIPTSVTPASTVTPADKIPSGGGPGGGGGGGGGGGLPEESASPTGGMRGVATEQAGVADIAMLYDPSLSLAENMARILGKQKNEQADAVDSALMYGGGIVQPTDLNNELLRIIEGR